MQIMSVFLLGSHTEESRTQREGGGKRRRRREERPVEEVRRSEPQWFSQCWTASTSRSVSLPLARRSTSLSLTTNQKSRYDHRRDHRGLRGS
ncbi:unnamed protein product [Boreogadus saida]